MQPASIYFYIDRLMSVSGLLHNGAWKNASKLPSVPNQGCRRRGIETDNG